LVERDVELLGRYIDWQQFQGLAEGPVMTPQEHELILKIRAQQVLGQGMSLNDQEFVQWVMDEYGLTRDRLTQLAKESI
jgi:hypothetical protein